MRRTTDRFTYLEILIIRCAAITLLLLTVFRMLRDEFVRTF